VSDNIAVRSIVGRFLEHSRAWYFENGGEPELYCASADWMERNFFRRVEVAFPISQKSHRERVLRDVNICLQDNCQAWKLNADGRYERIGRGHSKAVNAQMELLTLYAAGPTAAV
jgi:polyphosphate kinase